MNRELIEIGARAIYEASHGDNSWRGANPSARNMRPIAWAAWCTFGTPVPFIHEGSVRTHRYDVQKYIGEGRASDYETWERGWKRAYRAGWRAVKVRVERV